LIVATTLEELPILDLLYQQGFSNGLKGLRFLNSSEIKEFEPFCEGIRAILVPETGIIQYRAVAEKIASLLKKKGVEIIFDEEVLNIKTKIDEAIIASSSRELIAKTAIICAGLYSDRLALKSELDLPFRILPFRGEYFKFKPEAPRLVRNLIYPVPNPKLPFLGVHFTRMIDGSIECGPNAVLALGREAYNKSDFNLRDIFETLSWQGFHKLTSSYWKVGLREYWRSFNKNVFVKDLQKLVPEIKSSYLEPATAGIRAQACNKAGNLVYDFDIRTNKNLIHICNAPSPAATSSLAVGETIAKKALSFLE
jgi:L-2-hydroxyglutarate oxidase